MATFHELQRKFKDEDLSTYTDSGIARRTYQTWVDGLETCLKNGINNDIFVYLLQISNTELSRKEYQSGLRWLL